MTESRKESKGGFWIAFAAVLLFVIYPLSIGPAALFSLRFDLNKTRGGLFTMSPMHR